MQPDDKTQPLGAAKLVVVHLRRHLPFAAEVMMALTVVVLLALTIAGAENYFADGRGLSGVEAARVSARAADSEFSAARRGLVPRASD